MPSNCTLERLKLHWEVLTWALPCSSNCTLERLKWDFERGKVFFNLLLIVPWRD